ncbi:MAG: hypothetical protein QXX45_03780 [Candidatus Aenigmatarchaeota archaeon]
MNKPKFVLITYDGHGMPIALKLQQEGWDVIVGQVEELKYLPEEIPEEKERRLQLYDGIIEKKRIDDVINFLNKEKKRDDYLIFFDFNFLYPYANQIKQMGYFGIFPTKQDFELETNREMAKEYIFKNHNLFTKQEIHEFNKVEEAKEFLKNTDKVWVVKGKNINAETFVPLSDIPLIARDEVINILEEDKTLYEDGGFILEEKINDLIEFVPEIVIKDRKLIGMSIDVELKPIGPANSGFQTGDAASVIFWIKKQEQAEKIYDMFFRPMEEMFLRYDNEFVIWDIGVMYSPSRDKFYFSEFCPNREGWDSVFNKLSTFSRVGDYFIAIKNGIPFYELKPLKFGASFRIFNILPDKKYTKLSLQNSAILTDIKNKDIWLWDVKKVGNKLVSCGYDKNLAVVTGSDDDWQLAFLKADSLIDFNFKFVDFYKRSFFDIIDKGYKNNIATRIEWVFENILEEKFEFKPLYDYHTIKSMIINSYMVKSLEKEILSIQNLIEEFQSKLNHE